jgi:hypothetical protein
MALETIMIPQYEKGVKIYPELRLTRYIPTMFDGGSVETELNVLNRHLWSIWRRFRYVKDLDKDVWFNWKRTSYRKINGSSGYYNKGDCEDFMGLCALRLITHGVPGGSLGYAIVGTEDEDHAILLIFGKHDIYCMDNRYRSVLTDSKIRFVDDIKAYLLPGSPGWQRETVDWWDV